MVNSGGVGGQRKKSVPQKEKHVMKERYAMKEKYAEKMNQ